MASYKKIINQHLAAQIDIEEHFSAKIQEALEEIREESFVDVKDLLIRIREVLESNYTLLNKAMDKYDEPEPVQHNGHAGSGTNGAILDQAKSLEKKRSQVSRILRELYSDLNKITVANTQLYTMGLAFKSEDVAELAMKHLEELAPLVIKVCEIVPEVITRELKMDEPQIDITVAQKALADTRILWKFS